MSADKKKKMLFAGIGCLALIVLSCVLACLYIWKKGGEMTEQIQQDQLENGGAADPLIDKLARIPVTFILSNVVGECRRDSSSGLR